MKRNWSAMMAALLFFAVFPVFAQKGDVTTTTTLPGKGTSTTTTTTAPTTTTIVPPVLVTTTTIPLITVPIGARVDALDPGPIAVGQDILLPAKTVYSDSSGYWTEQDGIGNYQVRSSDESVAHADPLGTNVKIHGLAPGTAQIYFTLQGSNLKPPIWFGVFVTVYSPTEETAYKASKLVIYPRKSFFHRNSELELDMVSFENVWLGKTTIETQYPDGHFATKIYNTDNFFLTPGRQFVLTYIWVGENHDVMPTGRYKNWVTVTDFQGQVIGQNMFIYVIGDGMPNPVGGYPQPGRSAEVRLEFSDLYTDYPSQQPSVIGFYGIFPAQSSMRDVRILLDAVDMSFWNTRYFVTEHSTYFVGLDISGGQFPSAQHDVLLFFMNTGLVVFAENKFSIDSDPGEILPFPPPFWGSPSALAPAGIRVNNWIATDIVEVKKRLGNKSK